MTTTPSLLAEHLDFAFPRQPALFRDLSFAVQAGEIVGLIGPPSSGKSVLLKLLCGLLDAQRGTVSMRNGVTPEGEREQCFDALHESQRYALRRHIGMVFQNNALFDFLTNFENVAFPLRRQSLQTPTVLSEPALAEQVMDRLHAVGLAHTAHQYPHELSGGMKKRVALARATITSPRFCFYDEPTAGLDPVTAAKIYALITDFGAKDQAGAVVISNELDTLLPACHRVVMLYQGAIVYSGSPTGLAHAEHPAVRQFATGCHEGPL